jgi:hypothetical protein
MHVRFASKERAIAAVSSARAGKAPSLRVRRLPGPILLAMLIAVLSTSGSAAQSATGTESKPVIVTFETADGSTFRAVLAEPADIAAAHEALAGDGNAGIPSGALAYGDGGINAPHDWHMEATMLAEVTIELCDGTAAMVDEDVTYWVETVGQFCPWSATVIAVEPLAPAGGDDDGVADLPTTGMGEPAVGPRTITVAAVLVALAVLLGTASLLLGRPASGRE